MRLSLYTPTALALAAALLAGCATAPTPAPTPEPVKVRLIAFNDFHGNLEPTGLSLPWPSLADKTKPARLAAGGAAYLAGTVKALRDGASDSIVISSGDLIGGTPLVSALFLHEPTVDAANRIGVDIAIPGNHEFDAGKEELLRVMRGGCQAHNPSGVAQPCSVEKHTGAAFPLIAANVLTADGKTLFPASVVREVRGQKIGFIGAVTQITPSIVVPSGVAGLQFTDEATAINAEAARLKAQGVMALVAVIHEGGETGAPGLPLEWNDAGCANPRGAIFDINRQLSADIDVVFSAHTHQGYRCVIDGRPVMQATALGRGVSVADVVIDPRTGDVDRAKTTHRNLPVFNNGSDATLKAAIIAAEPAPWGAVLGSVKPVAEVADRVAMYAKAAAPRAQQPVGRINGAFERMARTDGSAGRLIADAQWLATRPADRGAAEFALMNPGGVRSDLRCEGGAAACTVTYGQAFTMQPFGNSLVVMTLKGAQVKQLLEDQQRPGRSGPSFLAPSSSLTYRWNAKAAYGQRVEELRVGGQVVDMNRDLRFTVNSFLADGGDGHVGLKDGRNRLGGDLDLDALTALLKSGPAPDATARITLAE